MYVRVIVLAALLAQTTPGPSRPDALTLLKDVAQEYAQATSYYIEAIEERTASNELYRHWEKMLLSAIVAADGRYNYEGRGSFGGASLVSNGTTKWVYHLLEQRYTAIPASQVAPSGRRFL